MASRWNHATCDKRRVTCGPQKPSQVTIYTTPGADSGFFVHQRQSCCIGQAARPNLVVLVVIFVPRQQFLIDGAGDVG